MIRRRPTRQARRPYRWSTDSSKSSRSSRATGTAGKARTLAYNSALPSSSDVVIVGAGAAGLATAIFTRELNPARSVALLDGAKRPGAKILVSGGGRCNVTNTVVSERDFWGGRATIIRQVLRGFPVTDTVEFFRRLGITLHEEADGKLFPDSNRARDVVDALLRELNRGGARLHPGSRVVAIERDADAFTVTTTEDVFRARAVVLATGGRSLPKTGSDGTGYDLASRLGHTVVDTTPALAPLLLDENHRPFAAGLSGVTHDAELTVRAGAQVTVRLRGSLLWTHFGISGPVALNASRHWARVVAEGSTPSVAISFCPELRFEDIEQRLIATARTRPRVLLQTVLAEVVPTSVAAALAEHLGLGDAVLARLSRDDRRRMSHALVEWPLGVAGTRGYNYAEATAGGIPLTEIDPSSMESRVCRGLYLVGEVLDVDGRIGGFNFQWAWASGRVAARAVART